MLDSRLHSLRRYPPHPAPCVDLVPGRAPGLTGPCRGQHQEPKTQLGRHRRLGYVDGPERLTYLLVGKGPEMFFHLRHRRQCAVDGLTRGIGVHEAVGHRPSEYRSHPLAHSPGGLWPGGPYRREHSQNSGTVYPVQGRVPQGGHGVALESLNPGSNVPGVAPAGLVGSVDCVGGLPEGGHRGRVLCCEGVSALGNGLPVVRSLSTGLRKAHCWKPAKTDVTSSTVDCDALNPGFAAPLVDEQMQATAVGVAPRFPESPCPCC